MSLVTIPSILKNVRTYYCVKKNVCVALVDPNYINVSIFTFLTSAATIGTRVGRSASQFYGALGTIKSLLKKKKKTTVYYSLITNYIKYRSGASLRLGNGPGVPCTYNKPGI